MWADDFAIAKTANVNALRQPDLAGPLTLTNATLDRVARHPQCDPRRARPSDRPAHRTDRPSPRLHRHQREHHPQRNSRWHCSMRPAVAPSPGASGSTRPRRNSPGNWRPRASCPAALRFPQPFDSAAGDYLVVPMNEGISYPVEDEPSIAPLGSSPTAATASAWRFGASPTARPGRWPSSRRRTMRPST